MKSVAEQRQMFRGADHAWIWKPKLRIPDIYESRENQLAFGRFLDACLCCRTEESLLDAIRRLDALGIRGLGPTAANLMYFLHPTLVPPFNTAMVDGFNAVSGARIRLGKWTHYLAMRAGMLELNARYRDLLSNDLGAIAGLLFDLGTGRHSTSSTLSGEAARAAGTSELGRVRRKAAREAEALEAGVEGDRTHTEIQGWLRDLGRALGFDVWIAANDRSRGWGSGRLGDGCLEALPPRLADAPGADAVRLIDVLWLAADRHEVVGAFEVEHTTSIYSGLVRLLDLALGAPTSTGAGLFLVAPDERESEVRAQLSRPAFSRVADMGVRYLPYGELARHRHSMARFGAGMKPIEALARRLP